MLGLRLSLEQLQQQLSQRAVEQQDQVHQLQQDLKHQSIQHRQGQEEQAQGLREEHARVGVVFPVACLPPLSHLRQKREKVVWRDALPARTP